MRHGLIMSYYGWDGRSDASKSMKIALNSLKDADIRRSTIIKLNDSGKIFDEIAVTWTEVIVGSTTMNIY
jgi:hypothetical protein